MPSEQDRVIDQTIAMLGLMVLRESLFKSGYPPEIQGKIRERITRMLERMGVKHGED